MLNPAVELVPPAIAQRALIGEEESAELTALFRVLANDTRLRILHAITKGRVANDGRAGSGANPHWGEKIREYGPDRSG